MGEAPGWDSMHTANDFYELIRSIVKEVIGVERPAYRYGVVDSIDPYNRLVYVIFNGEEDSVKCTAGSLLPVGAGQTVRVGGLQGDYFIEDVVDGVDPDDDTVTVKGVNLTHLSLGSGRPSGINFTDVYSNSQTHPNTAQWVDIEWHLLAHAIVDDAVSGTMITVPESTFTIPVDGTYVIYASCSFDDSNTTGSRGIRLVYDDGSARELNNDSKAANSPYGYKCTLTWFGWLPKGQLIKVQAYQSSGGPLDFFGQSPSHEFCMRIGMAQALPSFGIGLVDDN